MASCTECGNYTKYNNGLCKKCYESENKRSKETKNEKNTKYPSHTELYKDLHRIEESLVRVITNERFSEWDIKIEEDSWDIVINVIDTNWTGNRVKEVKNVKYYIEYKSSINEWGKQIDQFFRQIKSKAKRQQIIGKVILMSFDPAFEEYEKACEMAGIQLLVLDKMMLGKLRGTKEEYEMKKKLEKTNEPYHPLKSGWKL